MKHCDEVGTVVSRNSHLLLSVAYRDVKCCIALNDLIRMAVVWGTCVVATHNGLSVNVDLQRCVTRVSAARRTRGRHNGVTVSNITIHSPHV